MSKYRTGSGSDRMLDAAGEVVGLPIRGPGTQFELSASTRSLPLPVLIERRTAVATTAGCWKELRESTFTLSQLGLNQRFFKVALQT